MNFQMLLASTILCLLVCSSLGDVKLRKRQKATLGKNKNQGLTSKETLEEGPDVFDLLQERENLQDIEGETSQDVLDDYKDPCFDLRCNVGEVCVVDEDMTASCECIPECPHEVDTRRHVCSNHNETWNSDCSLHQMRCFCKHSDMRCDHQKYEHVHIDYYGKCQQMSECVEDEMEDFPVRMRDWLFNIMKDLAERDELSDYYVRLEREAESELSRKWSNAVIWKWCDLDGKPHDRKVSRHELFPIRAPLLSLEHCIGPFLDGCDSDDDHFITLDEWGKCLGLDKDDIKDKCEDVRTG